MRYFILLFLMISFSNPQIDWKTVTKDFAEKFDSTRFNKIVIEINEGNYTGTYNSKIITAIEDKRNLWKEVNAVFGRCDYIVNKDSVFDNSFLIYSNKAYRKFWVKYDSDDKIETIKIIAPKITMHLIPAPCGY